MVAASASRAACEIVALLALAVGCVGSVVMVRWAIVFAVKIFDGCVFEIMDTEDMTRLLVVNMPSLT
jgi:hypothetical protein